jgi:hypothetical protein
MLSFKRNGDKIEIKVETSIGWSYTQNIQCNDEPYAILLIENLNNKMFKELQRIREEAYLQGWNDKTKRNLKSNWWTGRWK